MLGRRDARGCPAEVDAMLGRRDARDCLVEDDTGTVVSGATPRCCAWGTTAVVANSGDVVEAAAPETNWRCRGQGGGVETGNLATGGRYGAGVERGNLDSGGHEAGQGVPPGAVPWWDGAEET